MRGMEYPTRRVVTIETIGFYTWYDDTKLAGTRCLQSPAVTSNQSLLIGDKSSDSVPTHTYILQGLLKNDS